MKFPGFSRYLSGLAVPVSALRSEKSFGIGEFVDLVPLGAWCREAGIDVIQILPVNDTGAQSSPYSALSACALHPVYLRPEDLPELRSRSAAAKTLSAEIAVQRKRIEAAPRTEFSRLRDAKLDILRRIYSSAAEKIAEDTSLRKWIDENPWVLSYALFCVLKDENNGASWVTWKSMRQPAPDDILNAWRDGKRGKDLLFHAWMQKRLEEQFRTAAEELDRMGIVLKGDLPILMSEDSADVWANPDFFRRDLRAGAPPDMFSTTGQNWGFPVYNWDALEKSGYSWWKERLRRADVFYHAYRIDHVLGFFRIWAVPDRETSGVLGYFKPSSFITGGDLEAAGFDRSRIRWLTLPHVAGEDIRRVFGTAADRIGDEIFTRLDGEDLFLFRDDVSESLIEGLPVPADRKDALLGWYRDRAFLEAEPGLFAPAWYREGSRAWKSLDEGEKNKLGRLVSRFYRESEEKWSREGEALLRFMKDATTMLPCAEDLGVVPDSVPAVLDRLGILGLRIPRWVRRYREPGEPYIPPREYPFLTVCAASVHDTTTLREWWEKEADREGFRQAAGLDGSPSSDLSPETAEKLFSALLETGSVLAMFQLQDFLALEPEFRVSDPAGERVNVPGTVSDDNWSYRTPFRIEELAAHESFKTKIRTLLKTRRERPFSG